MAVTPPTVVDLTWIGGLQFDTVVNGCEWRLDATGSATAPSPTDALGAALAGCMAIDVTDILVRGRHPLRALQTRLTANRAQQPPHRFVAVTLHLVVEGAVPHAALERAIQLSRDKYCAVWHSLRQDIDFTVTFDLVA